MTRSKISSAAISKSSPAAFFPLSGFCPRYCFDQSRAVKRVDYVDDNDREEQAVAELGRSNRTLHTDHEIEVARLGSDADGFNQQIKVGRINGTQMYVSRPSTFITQHQFPHQVTVLPLREHLVQQLRVGESLSAIVQAYDLCGTLFRRTWYENGARFCLRHKHRLED